MPLPILHRTGSGTPLVLLHCLGMNHHLWDSIHALGDRYELLSYDIPGHGETPLPEKPYSIEDLSHQLHDLLIENHVSRAHIMGISLGGLTAQHFAATWPEMTDHLVLADTTARYGDEARAGWPQRAAAARANGAASLLPMILKIWFTPSFAAADGPAVQLVRDTFAACSGEGYALACEALGLADLRELAAKITAPTLVLCGAEETEAFKEAARWLGEHVAGARVEWITSAAHASVLEQPERIMGLLREFLG